jgi:hypothetical protein
MFSLLVANLTARSRPGPPGSPARRTSASPSDHVSSLEESSSGHERFPERDVVRSCTVSTLTEILLGFVSSLKCTVRRKPR